ncbi:SDR family NAD(P)-dependent oxidoreductase [Actinorugispora endophytica]|uniref:Short-subunit dehydrogenase n=1 Tax=Actinorugispora endophytica TaxID=1605990 RepID=A0A4R6UWA0_9ACTN|nr:SDR family NAD(P)-dependent oxidoreductase [Actinorugispora endophytica]TDQ51562.1 short-subunit dehydrogenase [Actinorugispora endophytica]
MRGRAAVAGLAGAAGLAGTAVTAGVLAAAVWSGRRPVFGLRGRTALVTGGSRGLGLLLARELGARGCRVVVCARDGDELDRAAADLTARGVRAHALACDLRDPDAVRAMVADAAARFDGLDIVVNNAGIIHTAPLDSLDEADFHDAMDTVFWASLRVAQAARPHLRGGGVLVNITSIGGKISPPHLLPYACAKFAQVGLSEGLDSELARHGTRVLTVVPGLMRTGSPRRALFGGRPGLEYAWFAALASIPLVSMNGERAARRIVDAVQQGRHHLTLTPVAHTAVTAHGMAPRLTQAVLRAMNRVLPGPGPGPVRPTSGLEAAPQADRWGLGLLTRLNDRAGERTNQLPAHNGRHTPSGD